MKNTVKVKRYIIVGEQGGVLYAVKTNKKEGVRVEPFDSDAPVREYLTLKEARQSRGYVMNEMHHMNEAGVALVIAEAEVAFRFKVI